MARIGELSEWILTYQERLCVYGRSRRPSAEIVHLEAVGLKRLANPVDVEYIAKICYSDKIQRMWNTIVDYCKQNKHNIMQDNFIDFTVVDRNTMQRTEVLHRILKCDYFRWIFLSIMKRQPKKIWLIQRLPIQLDFHVLLDSLFIESAGLPYASSNSLKLLSQSFFQLLVFRVVFAINSNWYY